MKRLICLLTVISLTVIAPWASAADECTATYGSGPNLVRLATGSPGELGLVEKLAVAFAPGNQASVCWKKAGTGESLKLLKDKKVDLVMVHAPAGVKKALEEGWAVKRALLGSNEFYIVGPEADPAKIAQAKDAAEAYTRIAKAQAKFISRGDNSGTHQKEMAVWKKAGLNPVGAWYIVNKDFMMATLKKADAEGAYFMTDSSTWIMGRKDFKNLKVLFKGDPFLINVYHALCQPPGQTPGADLAAKFIDFVVSDKGQQIIGDYGKDKYGVGVYNDAAYAKQFDH